MKKVILDKIVQYLQQGPQNTLSIMNYLNNVTYYGISSRTLGNLLSRNSRFVKVGVDGNRTFLWVLAEPEGGL